MQLLVYVLCRYTYLATSLGLASIRHNIRPSRYPTRPGPDYNTLSIPFLTSSGATTRRF